MPDEIVIKKEAVGAAAGTSSGPVPASQSSGGQDQPPSGTNFFELLEKSPPAIKQYLLAHSTNVRFEQLVTGFQMTNEEIFAMVSVVNAIFFRTRTFKEFHGLLKDRLKWADQERLNKLAVEIAGQLFLPARGYIGDVEGFIRGLNGDPAAYPQDKLGLRLMSYTEGAKQIVAGAAKDLPPQFDSGRLLHIVESRLRSVRTDTQFKDQLMKPVKTGGLDLSPENADRILGIILTELATTTFIEDIFKPDPARASTEERFTPKKIREIYSGTPEEQADLARRTKNISEVAGRDPRSLSDWLFIQLFPEEGGGPDRMEIVASIMALAKEGVLWDVLAKDQRFHDLVADRLRAADPEEADIFDADPYQTSYFNFFLQMLLRGFASLTENDSARFGLRAVNLLKRTNPSTADAELVAFDADEGKFKWLEPAEV